METRYKLSTKVLSSFLAVLMAVSCFGIALPNLAPTASAAATSQDYKSLENAFDAVKEDDGSISASKYTVTAGEDGVTLIADATSDGSIYKLAEALFKVASAENGGYKHNTLIRERIKTMLAKNGYTYTSSMEDFVNTLLPVDGDYAAYSASPAKGTPKLVAAGEPDAVYTKTLTTTVKVTRSEKSVVLTYDDINDVPSKLDLTVKLTTVAEPKSSKNTFTSLGLEYGQLSGWYENTSCTVEHEQADTTDFSALKKFMSYVKSDSFAPYYEQYSNETNSIYSFDASVLEGFEEKFNGYYTESVYGLDNDCLDKYLTTGEGETLKTGLANLSAYQSFAAKMTAVYDPVFNRRFVDWVMKGTSVSGYIDRDAYLARANSAGEVVEPDKETVGKLLEQAKTFKDILNDATYNNMYVEKYGYVNGKIEELIQKIYVAYQRFTLDGYFENIVFRMENTSDKYFNDDMAYFGLADYDSSKYAAGEMPVTDAMLDTAIAWFDDLLTKINNNEDYDDEGRDAAVAAAGSSTIKTYAQVKDFYNRLVAERQSENREQANTYIDNYYSYFQNFIDNAPMLDTVYMTNAYATGINEKVTECDTAYAEAKAALGDTAAAKIFGDYNGRATLAKSAIKNALNARLLAMCQLMETYAGSSITEANFSLVKAQYGTINNAIIPATVNGTETTISLYQWCKNQGYTGADSIYNKYASTYNAQINAVIAKKFSNFSKMDLATGGVYTVRHATAHDMTRYLAGDGATGERYEYTVNKERVNKVITKLDTFLTSESFTQLLGVDGESKFGTGATISNLSEYIEDMLIANVFSDKVVNSVIAMLFPTITDILDNLFNNLQSLLPDNIRGTVSDGANAAINLASLGFSAGSSGFKVDQLKGNGLLYVNGNAGTTLLSKGLSDLGVKIYPTYFADAIGKTVSPQLYNDLKSAGLDWKYFDSNGNKDGKVDAEDFILLDLNGDPILDENKNTQPKYKWNVKDYNSFTSAMGKVFGSVLPILQVILCNYTYKTSEITKLLYLKLDGSSSIRVTGLWIPATHSISGTWANVSAAIQMTGMQGYNNLWGPIMEAAGISATTSSYDVSESTPLSMTIGTSSNNANAQQLVNALFMPLYALVKKAAKQPIATVMDILPNAAYYVSYGLIEPLLKNLQTSISVIGRIPSDNDMELTGSGMANIADWFRGSIRGALNNALNLSNIATINVGGLLNLSDLLGCDVTDLNAIANMVIGKIGSGSTTDKKVDIPAINAGKLGHLGSLSTATSIRKVNTAGAGEGKRYTINADRADVLYDIISWVLKFISGEGNLSGLLATFGSSGLDSELDSLLAEINAEDALAALVELFLPRGSEGSSYATGYDFATYDWYHAADGDWSYDVPYTAFVYTKYENYWTKEKADYLFNNLETVANDVIKKYAADLLKEKDAEGNVIKEYDGINEWLAAKINGMFNNEGIHNFTKAFSSIGKALSGNQTILDLLKEQINGGNGIDLACWYNTFGYLDYDYTVLDEALAVLDSADATDEEKAAARTTVATAPLKPDQTVTYTDADGKTQTRTYKSAFPDLTVEVTDGAYKWTYKDTELVDGSDTARRVFTDIFTYLFTPTLPLVNLLLTGQDLTLFNNAIVIKGYDCYSNGFVPLLEMLGITDLPTTAELMAMPPERGLNTLIGKLFDYVDNLLKADENGTTLQKVVKLLPRLLYFLQSDGLTTMLKNLIQPLWVLIDTVRPIADVDLDGFLHQFLCDYLGFAYDKNATEYKVGAVVQLVMNLLNKNKLEKEYTAAQIAADKEMVDAIYTLSIEDLSLTSIFKAVRLMFGIDLTPLAYAFEGMCIRYFEDGEKYGRVSFESKRGKTDYTVNYSGADILTVAVSVLLDVLRWGDNAKGFDKLFGFAKERSDREGVEITAAGLLETVQAVFTDKPFDLGVQPNWDYILEGKEIKRADGTTSAWVDIDADSKDYAALLPFSGKDMSAYHSIYNLQYFTDWTEDTAKTTVDSFAGVLDFVASLLTMSDGSKASSLKDFLTDLLESKVFNGKTLKSLADLMCKLYNALPVSAVELIDKLLDTNVNAWCDAYLEIDENNTYAPKADHSWWADEAASDYVDTTDEFIAALKELLAPASEVFAWVLLDQDIKLFYTYGKGVNKDNYGDDAVVLDGIGLYTKAFIPVLEALGYTDLEHFEFKDGSVHNVTTANYEEAVTDASGDIIMDFKLKEGTDFTSDFVDMLAKIIEDVTANPVDWLVERLPGIIYFVNANGFTTIVENVFDSVGTVIDIINTRLGADSQISLASIAKIINEKVGSKVTDITGTLDDELEGKLVLDFDTVIALIEKLTGIHFHSDLVKFMKSLYVGKLVAFTSGSGRQSFTMQYSDTEEKHDMVTIVLALLIEILEDKGTDGDVTYDNPAAIDKLITKEDEENKGIVSEIIHALKNPSEVIEKEMNWNYFDKEIVIAEKEGGDTPGQTVTVPAYKFLYLNYTTDWTKGKAKSVKESLNDLALAVLKMANGKYADATDVSAVVNDLLKLDTFYSADNLNKILRLLADNLYGVNAVIPHALVEFAGALLGADITSWNYTYAFEAADSVEGFTLDDTTGLYKKEGEISTNERVTDENGDPVVDEDGNTVYKKKTGTVYAVRTDENARADFISGINLIVKPAYRLLEWLLLGSDYTFFNAQKSEGLDQFGNEIHPTLITLRGANGYGEALSYLLEALGCTLPRAASWYEYSAEQADGTYVTAYKTKELVNDILTSLCNRVDKIAADPVYEIAGLIPELIYFINANGLSVVVNNLLGGVLDLIGSDAVKSLIGKNLNINDLVTDILRKALNNSDITFDIDAINLRYLFEIVEKLTGLSINDAIGSDLKYFYMGDLQSYRSASGKIAYRLVFSENDLDNGGNGQLQDFITILLSVVVDVLMYKQNAATIVSLANIDISVEVIEGIVDFLKEGFEVNTLPYDWFYFDESLTRYEIDTETGKLVPKEKPRQLDENSPAAIPKKTTMNYLKYATDWTQETADYIYQHRNEIIKEILGLVNQGSSDLGSLLFGSANLEKTLYTAENLNKILNLVKPTLGKIDEKLLEVLKIVVDIDLTSIKSMEEFTDEQITDRLSFVKGLCSIIQPLSPILDWLLFGNDIEYFDKKDYDTDNIEALISLRGSNGYLNGLVPLLEALGVILPEYKEDQTTEDVLYVLINNTLARLEGILANPVDEALALIPELLYFINANGLATCINNMLAGVVALLEKINPALGDNAINLQTLINKVLEDANVNLDLSKLDLLSIAGLVEEATGIEITDIFTETKIDKFYFGKIKYYKSANPHDVSFKMVYSEEEGPEDMLTFIVNLAVEILSYKDDAKNVDNAKAVDILINGKDQKTGEPLKNTVQIIVALLTNSEITDEDTFEYKTLAWNYFDKEVTLNNGITIPATKFVYLNYSNDWTYDKAVYLDDSLTAIVNSVLKLLGKDFTVEDFIAQKVDLDKLLFNADTLNKLLNTVSGLFYGENAVIGQHLAEVAGLVLGGELAQWNGNYSFAEYDSAAEYLTDDSSGLRYIDDNGRAIFAIENSDDFIAGLCKILTPLQKVLNWLLLGDSYRFFVTNDTDETIIKIPGKEGYKYGLTYLLEALGVKNLKSDYTDADALLKDVLTQVVARVKEILADPINEILALIPEIIYFINANGLGATVYNLAASVMNIFDTVAKSGLLDNLTKKFTDSEDFVNDLVDGIIKDKVSSELTFTLAGVNLEWIVNVVEKLTGFDLTGRINSLKTFAIGEVYGYESASENDAYKMRFGKTGDGTDNLRDRADMITIVLSYVIDRLYIEQNQKKLEEMANLGEGTVQSILNLLSGYAYDIGVDINWFYFDSNVTVEKIAPGTDLTTFTPTINYLQYATEWTADLADYLDENLDDVIATILDIAGKGDTTVAQIVKDMFDPETDLYTAEVLNKLANGISGLVSKIDESLTDTLGILLDVDLGAYKTMDFGTGRVGKVGFIEGICEIVKPLSGVLDWLLFGDSYSFFSTKYAYEYQDLLTLKGYSGYAYGLVPLLEALGVKVPVVSEESNTANTVNGLVTALVDRIEEILVDPVNEVLALIPNILYFINANGLASAVNNLLGAAVGLVDRFNEGNLVEKLGLKLDLDGDGVNDTKIDLNGLINKLLSDNGIKDTEIDIKKLDLIEIIKVVEAATGLDLETFVRDNGIENFYLGQITYFTSANGSAAFRMKYSSNKNKDRSDLITVVFNYLIEAALYKNEETGADNAKAIDILISGKNDDGTPKKNTVAAIVDMIGKLGTEPVPGNYHWNYMNEDSDDVTPEAEYDAIVLPATPFNNYLTYCTDWTQSTADYLYDNLGTVINAVIKMTGNGDSLADLVNGKFTLYKAEYLNKILDAVKKVYDLADAKVLKLLGLAVNCDLTVWDGMKFEEGDVVDSTTFAAGITQIAEPIYSLLDWLLFGKSFEFFVKDKTGETLINIAGADGYLYGLAPLFIALGVDLPAYKNDYTCKSTVEVDGVEMTFFNAVIKSVLARVDEILANPVDEALDLLPGLLYFINANGVSTAAYNLLGGVLNAVNVLVENNIISLGGTSVEEYVETKLGLNVKNLDLEGIVKFLENKNITKGIKIYDVFNGIYNVDENGSVTFTPDASAYGNILEKFYCGEVKSYTYSGINGWQMVTKAGEGRGDMITTLLSIVLEVLFYDGNEQPITDIIAGLIDGFTVENFVNLKALLSNGVALEKAIKNIDWVYFNEYATEEEREEAIRNVILDPASNLLPSTQPERTTNYLKYDNNWNEDTAKYIDDNIVSIVDLVIAKFVDGSDSLTDFIDSKLNIYSDDVANKILAKLGSLLQKLDDSLVDTIGVVLDADLKALTAPVSGVTDKKTFVAALANRLSNIGNVLDWLLFDQQMTFFTDLETGAQAKIVLNGGEGYRNGLAPILEAIGVDTHITVPEAAEGTSISARILVELLTNVCDRIDEVLADPINEALALLPELIYFINANGVSVSAMNLVAPIDVLLKEVGSNIGKEDLNFSSLVKFDISNLDFEGIFAILLDKTGIDAQSPIGEYLAKFYFGQLETYTSYGEVQGFRMVYSEDEARFKFVTVLVTLLLDVATYDGNKDAIIKLLGNNDKAETIYNTVMAFISGKGTEVQVPMKYFDWAAGEYDLINRFADTGKPISPIIMDSIWKAIYGKYYTREMGEYITKYFPSFIDTMITLLGVEIKGVNVKSLEDLIKSLVGDSIYTTDTLNKLLGLIQGLVPKLKDAIGDELFNHLANIVNNSIGVNLNYWNDYTVNEIKTGDKNAFVDEIVRMLHPAMPILQWLLCDKELAFFNTQNGNDYIVIESAEGYAYGIIPILEALHCDGILSIEDYKAAAEVDSDNLLRNILDPLLTKVDAIFKDPVNQILDILPSVVYFLNIGGLDVVVRNTLNAVAKVLETVEPAVGKDLDLAKLFGFDFTVDIEGLLDKALKNLDTKYGFSLTTVATEAIRELTVGTLDSMPDSESGQWVYGGKMAYTMHYADGSSDRVDMATIILRLVLRFISDPQNVEAIKAMLKPKLNETGYKFLTSLLDNFSQMVGTEDGMDKVMYTVYYIFYAANIAAHETKNWLANFNGNYSFLNQLFSTSDLAFMRQLEKSFGDLLNKYTPDIVDDDEIVPNGFVKFFKALKDFFAKILAFFKNMFKR